MEDTNYFGPHLMISGKGTLNLDCQKAVYDYLDRLPDLIGMTKIIPPYVFPYEGLVPEDKGITGAVIIAESHITVHTFSDKDYVFVDIFSCKPFNVDKAIEYTKQWYGLNVLDTPEVETTYRGRNFPRS